MWSLLVRRRIFVLTFVLALTLPSGIVQAQTPDPLIGTWNLDVFKSVYNTSVPPVKRTIKFEPAGDSIHQTMETTNQGFNISETVKVEYTAKFDGADYPIKNSGLDTVALKRINATTIERTGKIRGKATETATMKLSNNNKTLTITTKGTTDTGAEYSRTEVFQRQ